MDSELEKLLVKDVSPEQLEACKEALEILSTDEKIEFSTHIVMLFSSEELSDFYDAIEVLRPQEEDKENSIHEFISQAIEVRQRIEVIFNDQALSPYQLLLPPEFNADLFIQFRDLCNTLTEKNAVEFATHLVAITPRDNRGHMARNVNLAFGERSDLAIALEAALLKVMPVATIPNYRMFPYECTSGEQKTAAVFDDAEMDMGPG